MSAKRDQSPALPAKARRAKLFLYALIVGIVVLNFFLWRMASRPPEKAPPPAPTNSQGYFQLTPDKTAFAAYAGSASCKECHPAAYANWEHSHHALAERPLDPVRDQPAFAPGRTVKHGTQTTEVRLAKGRFELHGAGPDGVVRDYPIVRALGESPLRQFLVPMDNGRLQVTEVAIDSATGEWFDVYGAEDRRPGEWGHWTGRGMTWNLMCAGCHNTRLRKHYDPATDTYNTSMAEMAVGCEACHGPLASHVDWQRHHPLAGRPSTMAQASPAPPDPLRPKDPTIQRFSREQWLDVCGTCHARRAELTGDFVPGDRFENHFSLTIPDDTDIYYPDGQVRDENYEFTSFRSSRMHAAGVKCWDCHDVHTAKVPTVENMLCMRCHGGQQTNAPVINLAAHSYHKPGTPGDRCVDCHMPLTTYMQRHARRDHGYTIPDPLLTKEHDIPNACTRCHQDKSVDWALEAANKWYGPRLNRPTRARAQMLAQARAGKPGAHTNLVHLARTETLPLWRAVAAGMLKSWCADPAATAVLLDHTADPDPLVRAYAARALEPLVQSPGHTNVAASLTRLLADPVRLVRVDAAWALRATLDTNSVAGRDLLWYLAQNADMPSAMLQDGVFHLDRGMMEPALALFRKAVRWDGGSPPLRHALAVALSLQGNTTEAVSELETACRLAPQDAEMRFKLGLALNEAGRPRDALAALEAAVKLEPQYGQAWYNLGLAYSAQNNLLKAGEALAEAEKLNPRSAQISYALATILARQERTTEAQAAVQRALALEPAFPEALSLFQMLSSKP